MKEKGKIPKVKGIQPLTEEKSKLSVIHICTAFPSRLSVIWGMSVGVQIENRGFFWLKVSEYRI